MGREGFGIGNARLDDGGGGGVLDWSLRRRAADGRLEAAI